MNLTSILLHTCCAPCAVYVVRLLNMGFNVHCFFYNPNIYPKEEYIKRLDTIKYLSEKDNFILYTGEYEPEKWNDCIKGFENEPEGGKRCYLCYKMRLEQTALKAIELGIPIFTTTLSVSPHKKAEILNEIGNSIAINHNLQFFNADFKKKDGYKKSIELSKMYNLYRQNYCGCIFSIRKEF